MRNDTERSISRADLKALTDMPTEPNLSEEEK
jgi:hypothetical protein